MTRRHSAPRHAGLLLALGAGLAPALAGCATDTPPKPVAAAPVAAAPAAPAGPVVFQAAPGLSPAERGARAQVLLGAGQLGPARAELDALLAQAPDDPVGRSLQRQVSEDPRRLLPSAAVAHTVQPGETLPDLAERYLGDRTLFWALARYNGLPVPNSLHPGEVLQIPRAIASHHAAAHGARGEGRGEHAAAKAPAPAAPVRDPARAARLRGEGLEALSRGQADRAVGLLQSAAQADPANASIGRDLARAERIRAQLHNRH